MSQDLELGQPYIPAEDEHVSLEFGAKVVLPEGGSQKFPGVWTVVKINAVSYGLEQNGVPLRAHKSLVRRATPEEILEFASATPATNYLPGTLVRAPRARKMSHTALYVVLSDKTLDPKAKLKVALLGGEGAGRTWTVPRSFLEAVTLAEAGLL